VDISLKVVVTKLEALGPQWRGFKSVLKAFRNFQFCQFGDPELRVGNIHFFLKWTIFRSNVHYSIVHFLIEQMSTSFHTKCPLLFPSNLFTCKNAPHVTTNQTTPSSVFFDQTCVFKFVITCDPAIENMRNVSLFGPPSHPKKITALHLLPRVVHGPAS